MLKRTALVALAAAVSLGVMASNVQAKPGGFSPGAFKPGVFKPIGIKPGVIKPKFPPIAKLPPIKIKPKFPPIAKLPPKLGCWKHPWLCKPPIKIVKPLCWKYPWSWHCRTVVGVGVVGGVAAVGYQGYTAAPRATCTCLTKEYLPNGAVLFKDVCTKEFAANPPLEQAAEVQPQVQQQ